MGVACLKWFLQFWNAFSLQSEFMILSFVMFVHDMLYQAWFNIEGKRERERVRLEICNGQLHLPSRSINKIGSLNECDVKINHNKVRGCTSQCSKFHPFKPYLLCDYQLIICHLH